MPNGKAELPRRSSASSSRSSFMSHQPMTVLGLHPPRPLGMQSPSADLLLGDGDGHDDDGHDDDDDDDYSSPPPLLSPSSRIDSPATPLEPSSRPASRPPARLSRNSTDNVKNVDSMDGVDGVDSADRSAGDTTMATHGLGGGDVVLVANLPDVFTVGYDSVSFTARHFGGVRELPIGPHFFWFAHPGGASARSGFWIFSHAGAGTGNNPSDHLGDDSGNRNGSTTASTTTSGDARHAVHLFEWDRFYETLSGAPAAETRAQAARIGRFYAKLAPYRNPSAAGTGAGTGAGTAALTQAPGGPQDHTLDANIAMWRQLTDHISEPVLDRVAGRQATAWHVHTADRVRGAILLAAEMELEKRFAASPALEARELRFTFDQHAKTYSVTDFGPDRSLAARDPTDFILHAIAMERRADDRDDRMDTDDRMIQGPADDDDNNGGLPDLPHRPLSDSDIIGELEFAYVTGMHLGNDACLQQWWHMVLKLFLKAHDLVEKRPSLAAAFLQAVSTQIVYGSDWLDGSILEYGDAGNGRDLRLALIVYKRRLEEALEALDTTTTTTTTLPFPTTSPSTAPSAPSAAAAAAAIAAVDVAAPSHTTTTTNTTAAAAVTAAAENAITGVLGVATAFSRLEAAVAALGWDIRGDYVRRGKMMLEDGEEVELEMTELEDEDERGEWAPEVVEIDEDGRERGLVSWRD